VVLVRAAANPMALAAGLRRIVAGVDPGLAVFGLEPLQDTVARSVSRQRFTMVLLGLFAGLALLLAGIGIHGVLSYGVASRSREIGIRMALGERPGSVLRLVLGEALGLAALGVALGLAGAVALTGALEALLFGVTATDPVTFAVTPVFLLVMALVAAYTPARRAIRVDPVAALRAE
jgi:putative ABC transport system permease protein